MSKQVPTLVTDTMSSREIAELTGKEHKHVKRDIEVMCEQLNLQISQGPTLDGEIQEKDYVSDRGRTYQEYHLKRRECEILITGYDIVRRAAVIDRWYQLEVLFREEQGKIAARQAARIEFKPMMRSLKEMREIDGKETKFFHYSNEADMLNRIVLGDSAARFCKHNGIPKECLREHLNKYQLEALAYGERMNESLIEAGLEFKERKVKLAKVIERKFGALILTETCGLVE